MINLDYDVDYELIRLIGLFDSGHDPCEITLDKTSGASVMTFCDGISATLGWNFATIIMVQPITTMPLMGLRRTSNQELVS